MYLTLTVTMLTKEQNLKIRSIVQVIQIYKHNKSLINDKTVVYFII